MKTTQAFVLLLVCLFLSMGVVAQETAPVPSESTDAPNFIAEQKEQAIKRWGLAIDAFDRENEAQNANPDALLFIGSSSIRRWESIASDMPPYRTIKRGDGGAKFSDLAVFAERLIHPHQYRGMVIFVADDLMKCFARWRLNS